MRFIATVISTVGLFLAMNVANAGEFNVGVNGGYSRANDLHDSDLYNAQVYGQYKFDGGFGIEGGYNYFGGGEYKTLDDIKKNVKLHGPYLAASLNSSLGSAFDLYARGGAMYAITDGDVPTENRISPFVGVGIQANFTDSFYFRGGYDHYFNAIEVNADKVDVDLLYAGLGFSF